MNTLLFQSDQVISLNTSCVKTQFIQVQIQFNSCYCGIALTSIQLPVDCIFLGIVRAGRIILASAEPTIYCGDYVREHPTFAKSLNGKLTIEIGTTEL